MMEPRMWRLTTCADKQTRSGNRVLGGHDGAAAAKGARRCNRTFVTEGKTTTTAMTTRGDPGNEAPGGGSVFGPRPWAQC